MVHKQQDVRLAKTYPQRHDNPSNMSTNPCKGKVISQHIQSNTSHSQETKCIQFIKAMLLNHKVHMTFSSKVSSTYQSIHDHIRVVFTTKTYS